MPPEPKRFMPEHPREEPGNTSSPIDPLLSQTHMPPPPPMHPNQRGISGRNLLTIVAAVGIVLGLTYAGYSATHHNAKVASGTTPKITPAQAGTTTTGTTATGAGNLNLSPAAVSAMVGSTITVQVEESSSATAVNALEADFNYPAALLQFVSIDATNSAFPIQAINTGGSGVVKIARGTTTPITGDKPVANVTFKVLAAGTASLAFTSGSALVTSSTHGNILGKAIGSTYTLTK